MDSVPISIVADESENMSTRKVSVAISWALTLKPSKRDCRTNLRSN